MLPSLAMWSLLVGVLLPPIVAVINQPRWPGWVRLAMTVLLSAVAGAGTAYFTGDLTGKRWTEAVLVVALAAVGAYQAAWKPSGIAPRLERAGSRPRMG